MVALVRRKECVPNKARIKSYHGRPVGNKAGILPCGEAAILASAAAEQEAAGLPLGEAKIFIYRLARLLGYFKPDRAARFLLPDRGAFDGIAVRRDILHLEAHHIAAAQLAIDGEIEQRQIAYLPHHLQMRADRPDMLRL